VREEFWNKVLHTAERLVGAYEKAVALEYARHPELNPVVVSQTASVLKPVLPPAVVIPRCAAPGPSGARCTLSETHPTLDHWDETRSVEWPNESRKDLPPPPKELVTVVSRGLEEMPDQQAARETAETAAREAAKQLAESTT
jgi:hypothetical protein